MPVGYIDFIDTQYGLLIKPRLYNLPPGLHGFHFHENPSCAKQGLNAAGHLDPLKTNKHLGPYENGHLGDLPALYTDKKGISKFPILAPRLKTQDLIKHSIMIHSGGDNYADTPKKLGGGGKKIAWGGVGAFPNKLLTDKTS